jgi:hypothetical protein
MSRFKTMNEAFIEISFLKKTLNNSENKFYIALGSTQSIREENVTKRGLLEYQTERAFKNSNVYLRHFYPLTNFNQPK